MLELGPYLESQISIPVKKEKEKQKNPLILKIENWGRDWPYFSSPSLPLLFLDWRKITRQVQGDHCHTSRPWSPRSHHGAWVPEWLQGNIHWLALLPRTEVARSPGSCENHKHWLRVTVACVLPYHPHSLRTAHCPGHTKVIHNSPSLTYYTEMVAGIWGIITSTPNPGHELFL